MVCKWCSKNTMVLLFPKSDVKYLPCPKLFLYSNISQWLSPRWCVTFPAWHEHYYPQISLVCSRWVCGVCVHTSCRYSQADDDDDDGVLKSWVCPCSSPDWEESPQSLALIHARDAMRRAAPPSYFIFTGASRGAGTRLASLNSDCDWNRKINVMVCAVTYEEFRCESL